MARRPRGLNLEKEQDGELISSVRRVLDNLPLKMRHCVVLYAQGRTYFEIAIVLNLPIGTVKSYIHKARQRLKEALGEQFDGFGH